MDILDNQNSIAQRDGSDALGLTASVHEQLRHDFGIHTKDIARPRDIHAVVFAGMGGSALQAEFVRAWPRLSVPFVIWKDYDLPDFVNEHTLVIVASYSGNTEETLTSLGAARNAGAMIAVMAGGGKLQAEAEAHDDPFFVIPKAVQPRMAVLYAFRMLLEMVVAYGLVDRERLQDLDDAADFLQTEVGSWLKEIPTEQNPAKQLALKLVGKTPIYYAGREMAPAAYKWKIGTNENAKNTAWWNTLPEFNHNEFMGWTSHPVEKPFAVVDLVSSFEHERVLRRFEVSDRLLSGMRPHSIRVEAKGETVLQQLLYLVVLGDFVTIYLGLLNGVDPSPVELIEKFKKELG